MRAGEHRRSSILWPAAIFCLSFTLMFVALGMTATGHRLDPARLQADARHASPAIVIVAMGVFFLLTPFVAAAQPRVAPRGADLARGRRRADHRRAWPSRSPGRRASARRWRRSSPPPRPPTASARAASCWPSTASAWPSRSCSPRSPSTARRPPSAGSATTTSSSRRSRARAHRDGRADAHRRADAAEHRGPARCSTTWASTSCTASEPRPRRRYISLGRAHARAARATAAIVRCEATDRRRRKSSSRARLGARRRGSRGRRR